MNEASNRPKIVVIGAGFGGLSAVRKFADKPVDVLLIDRNNYHTFTPLLYQVATCALDPSEIAYPVRSIFNHDANVEFLLGTVAAIDTEAQQIWITGDGIERVEQYDYLLIATGSTPTYFGNQSFSEFAFELDTLGDAIDLRNHILRLFERAIWTEDRETRAALLTIVIAGGGPTGLETAGAIYELYNHVLDRNYPQQALQARVILVEPQQHLLGSYPHRLQHDARDQLASLGVEIMLERQVTAVGADYVELDDGERIASCTLVWAAGVKGSPLAEMLGVELTKRGLIRVHDTLAVIGIDNVYAVGDVAYLEQPDGGPFPMLIPVAQQQGEVAAENMLNQLQNRPQRSFRYHDRGIMATIGRRRAVAWIFNRVKLRGRLAWFSWLLLHIVTLMGFRNRLNVFVNWTWNYFTFDRSVRLILERRNAPSAESVPANKS